jgi:hypothetical protein
MNQRTRHNLLTTGRSGDFRNLARDLTNHPDDFPTKTALRASIKEIYPEAEPKALEAIFGKLTQIAQARAAGADLLELRGVVDEYVIKVESELADEDRLIAAPEDTEPVDASGTLAAMDDWDPAAKRTRAIMESRKQDELNANRLRQMGGR